MSATGGPVQHLVFDATPGYYAGGAAGVVFSGHTSPLAFEIPAGQVVYLGDFIYTSDRKVDLRRDINAAKAALAKSYPNARGELVLAKAVPVPILQMFLCAP